MKSVPSLLIGTLLLSGCVAAQHTKPVNTTTDATASWPWSSSMDAVNAAPKNHKVLYEDDRVRILEVTVQPGEKENMHTHQWPSVLIVDSPAKKKEYTSDGKVISTDRPSADTPCPSCFAWVRPNRTPSKTSTPTPCTFTALNLKRPPVNPPLLVGTAARRHSRGWPTKFTELSKPNLGPNQERWRLRSFAPSSDCQISSPKVWRM